MKNMIILLALISSTAFAGMWELVSIANSGGQYYCTYRLQGTNVTQVIVQLGYCQQYVFK